MVFIRTALVREALVLQNYAYYHYTHHKISVLMVLIIEACEAIRLLHYRLKCEFSIFFHEFDYIAHKSAHNFAVLNCTIFFLKLHCVPHVILHLVVYILLRNSKMADRSLQRM